MHGYVEIPLLDLTTELGDEAANKIINDFSCPMNKDVEFFLKSRAIEFAKQGITQTHLVFASYKGETRLIGYFSLTSKVMSVKDTYLSNSIRRRIAKFGTRDLSNKGYVMTAPLIAQLGKNYTDGLNKQLTGNELLKMALDKVAMIQRIIGGKIVYLECEDIHQLKDFYSRNGFVEFGQREKDSEDADRIKGQYLLQLLKVIK
ncbi:N-acetyltransferase [Paenibacillus xylanexedens]|nr:N-acetyltransferase [Paenibacillus xylanexedens]